jgi:hypothetical protein
LFERPNVLGIQVRLLLGVPAAFVGEGITMHGCLLATIVAGAACRVSEQR